MTESPPVPYVTRTWGTHEQYVCPECGYSTFSRVKMDAHLPACPGGVTLAEAAEERPDEGAATAAPPDTLPVPPVPDRS